MSFRECEHFWTLFQCTFYFLLPVSVGYNCYVLAVSRAGAEFVEEFMAKNETLGLTGGFLPVYIMP